MTQLFNNQSQRDTIFAISISSHYFARSVIPVLSFLTNGLSKMVRERISKSYAVCADCTFSCYGATRHFAEEKHTGYRYYICLKSRCVAGENVPIFTSFSKFKQVHTQCSGQKVSNHHSIAEKVMRKNVDLCVFGQRLEAPASERCIIIDSSDDDEEENQPTAKRFSVSVSIPT